MPVKHEGRNARPGWARTHAPEVENIGDSRWRCVWSFFRILLFIVDPCARRISFGTKRSGVGTNRSEARGCFWSEHAKLPRIGGKSAVAQGQL